MTTIIQELKKAAASMGYRPIDPKQENTLWGKPLGNTLISLDLNEIELTQWFYNGKQELDVWSRDKYNPEGYGGATDPNLRHRFTNWIKYYEGWFLHPHDFSVPPCRDFSFLSLEEEFAISF